MYHARLNRYLVCEWVVSLLLLATVLAFAAIRVNSRATELFGSNSSPNGSAQRHRRRPGRISRVTSTFAVVPSGTEAVV